MKLKVETKQIVEIDVEFPMYKKYGSSVYKIIDERKLIEVNNCGGSFNDFGICIGNLPYLEIIAKYGKDITEQQYHEAFIDVMKMIEKESPVAELL